MALVHFRTFVDFYPLWYNHIVHIVENGMDSPAGSRQIKQPTFADGEQDLWPFYQESLQRFDSLSDAEYTYQVNRIEKERNKYIRLLTGYALKIGYSFEVTLPELVNRVQDASSDDIWAHFIEEDGVQIPRYVLENRPKSNDHISFRKEIPTAHILVNMAHELSHLERRRIKPEMYKRIFKDSFQAGRHEVNFTSEIREEEMSTDQHAFQLLKNLGIPITPATFVSQIPRNDSMPNYRQEMITRLTRLE